MVPKTPSCYCTLLMFPSRLKFLRIFFTFVYMRNNHCYRVTAHWQLSDYYYYYYIIIFKQDVPVTH
jgi:hypothetical protein